jgi:hypothetical protein
MRARQDRDPTAAQGGASASAAIGLILHQR